MYNSVTLVGRLVKDVDLRYTQNGIAVANFTLAVESGYGEKKSVDFINCVAWRNTAEAMAKYTEKGKLILASGRITTRNYEGKDGKKVYVTEVMANEVKFLEWADKKEEEPTEKLEEIIINDEDLPF